MASPSIPPAAPGQQHCFTQDGPSCRYLSSAFPGQFLPHLYSPSLDGAQVQQRPHPFPCACPGLGAAPPFRFQPPLPPLPSHAANHACAFPLQQFSPSGYQDAGHVQFSLPSRPQVMSLGNHGYLSQGDRGALNLCSGQHGSYPGQFPPTFRGENPPLPREFSHFLPSLSNSSGAVFSAGGTGHESHNLPSSYPLCGGVRGGGYIDEGGEGWNLRGNQHSVGTSSQPSSSGGILTNGRESGFGWLRYGGGVKTHWTGREQEILEDGLLEYATERTILQYAQISLNLHGEKSIRDVALRCKHWIDTIGDSLLNQGAHMDAEVEHAIPNYGCTEDDNARKLFFQQNDHILGQIIHNQKLLKGEDNTNLFTNAYDNIMKLLACLNNGASEAVSENLKKLYPFEETFKLLEPPRGL